MGSLMAQERTVSQIASEGFEGLATRRDTCGRDTHATIRDRFFTFFPTAATVVTGGIVIANDPSIKGKEHSVIPRDN